jgi:predicted nucleic acid-binding protein
VTRALGKSLTECVEALLEREVACHVRDNFSAYGACDVALTEHLGAELLTRDGGIASAAREQATLAPCTSRRRTRSSVLPLL